MAPAQDPAIAEYRRRLASWPGADGLDRSARGYGLAGDDVVALILALESREHPPEAEVTREGQVPDSLLVLNRGTLEGWKILDGAPVLVGVLGPPAVIGAVEALKEHAISVTYRTASEAELLVLPRTSIRTLQAQIPELELFLDAYGFDEQSTPSSSPVPLDDADEAPEDRPGNEDEEAPPIEHFLRSSSASTRRTRVRWVRQHDETDCGAACLSMIAQSYGRRISLASYRSLIHVTREGASIWSLTQAARKTGFDVAGVQTSVSGLRNLVLPALVLFKYHFVVLYEISEKFALISDPGPGIQKISLDEFERHWTGMALLLRPTERLFSYPETASGYREYALLLKGMWGPVAEVLAAALLFFSFSLVPPLVAQITFDRVLVDQGRDLLHTLVAALVVVALSSRILGVVRSYMTGFVANRFHTVFSALTYRHVIKLPLSFFMVRRVGDILTRFGEITKIRQFFAGDTLVALIQMISVGVYLGALSLYSGRLGAIVAVIIPLFAVSSVVIAKRLRKAFESGFLSRARAQSYLVEQMRALESVKAMSAELPSRWRWEVALRSAVTTRFRVKRLQILTTALSTGIEQLATTFVLYLAAGMATHGELTVGKVIASGLFLSLIFGPIRDLAASWNKVQETQVSFERIDDIITCAPEPSGESSGESPGGTHPTLAGNIEFRDVWFQYGSDLSPWALKNVSLTVRAGETIAVVGRSGSGKSTLVQMLNLLYRPTRGTVLIDGQSTLELPLAQVRASIGMVLQDSQLFAGSVIDNITLGADDPSFDLAVVAARAANAHTLIASLPGGYNAEVEERGSNLSGGERQRINIARALYRRPSILVLDEATSSLDSESERAVVEGIKVFCRGRTSIIIAHRLSTILHADRVILMEGGEPIEMGTHEELIRKGGAYARLFRTQLAS